MRATYLVTVFLSLASSLPAGEPKGVSPADSVYFETEEFFSLKPIKNELQGAFGDGYRVIARDDAPTVLDKTVFLFGNTKGSEGYAVWVRAYSEPNHDRRVCVEWIGDAKDEADKRFKPTHGGGDKSGFYWKLAGKVIGKRRHFYQLRLNAVDGSQPIVDAVLLTADPDLKPQKEVRPSEDPKITGGDGEGSTTISHQTLTAGTENVLRVVYTVGASGIADGGALRFFLPESWSPPQTGDSTKPGYVTAKTSAGDVKLGIDCHLPSRGAYAFSRELRHRYEVFIRVGGGSLKENDTVTINYTATVQPYAQSADNFRNEARAWYSPALPLGIWSDADGDGTYWPVVSQRSHKLEVIADAPAEFSVVAPSIVATGEPLAVTVAALDKHRNPATSYCGTLVFSIISLEGEKGKPGKAPSPVTLKESDLGRCRTSADGQIDRPGYYAVAVRDKAGKIKGISNAIRATKGKPPWRIYWGDLHTHHRRCDGLRRFDEAATHARDVAGLDVLALSPHACYITDGDLADLWRVDEQFHKPGQFATIFAYEWAAGKQGAPHPGLYSRRPIPLVLRGFGAGNVVRGRPDLYKQFAKHKLDLIEVPHHLRGVTKFNPKYQKALEVYSQWGSHEAGAVNCFDHGQKACLFGASDNHTGQPGLQSESNRWAIHHHLCGLTAFLTPNLTRDDLFKAVDARRCYGTAACRIIAELKVNGHEMGEEFTMSSPSQPRRIEIEAASSTPIALVSLVRNGQTIQTWKPGKCVVRLDYTDTATHGGPTDYYYARIEVDEIRKAWLTPVWVTFERPVASPERRLQAAVGKLKNLARGKPVTTSFPKGITHGKPEKLTDGKFDDWLGHGTEGEAWVQVDLGDARKVAFVRLFNFFRDGRTFHGSRVAISTTGEFAGEEKVIFDSRSDGEYAESRRGRVFACDPTDGRYVRSWLNGNTSNVGSQWVELQVYGPLPAEKK